MFFMTNKLKKRFRVLFLFHVIFNQYLYYWPQLLHFFSCHVRRIVYNSKMFRSCYCWNGDLKQTLIFCHLTVFITISFSLLSVFWILIPEIYLPAKYMNWFLDPRSLSKDRSLLLFLYSSSIFHKGLVKHIHRRSVYILQI